MGGGTSRSEPGCRSASAGGSTLAYARSAPTLEPSALEREIEDAVAAYDSAIEELAMISMTSASDRSARAARIAVVKPCRAHDRS